VLAIGFKSLRTNIPVEEAIKCIEKIVEEYQDAIPNAIFITDLLEIILKNSLILVVFTNCTHPKFSPASYSAKRFPWYTWNVRPKRLPRYTPNAMPEIIP